MPSMRRFAKKDFIDELKKFNCTDHDGYKNPDAPGDFMRTPCGTLFQIPDSDDEGYIPEWQLLEILEINGISAYTKPPTKLRAVK